jgi:hypothetical protein
MTPLTITAAMVEAKSAAAMARPSLARRAP